MTRELAEREPRLALAHQRRQLLVDDLHDLLARRQALEHLLAERPLAHARDEVADDGEVDVGLEQREADLAHRARDRLLVEPALLAQVAEDALQLVGEACRTRPRIVAARPALGSGQRCPTPPPPTATTQMRYRRCGRSGLKLPAISLGLWHNFGGDRPLETSRAILRRAFDLGVTHFDLANNYGPPYGSAEETFGRIMRDDLRPYRDELVISTKAGYDMWPGPYGEWGSRKYLLASLDQSLGRMGLDYVDIFYSHRFDPETPLEETMGALDTAVRQGKALYAGISSYSPEQTREAAAILRDARHAAAHPPAVVLAAEPLDRAGSARRARRARRRLHLASRRSRRGCSPTSTSTGSPRARAPSQNTSLSPDAAHRRDARRRSAR